MRHEVPDKIYDGLTVEAPILIYFACAVGVALYSLLFTQAETSAVVAGGNVVGLMVGAVARWLATRYVRPPPKPTADLQ